MINLKKEVTCRWLFCLLIIGMLVMTACSSKEQTEIDVQSGAPEQETLEELESEESDRPDEHPETAEDDVSQKDYPQSITVYVCGAVNQPGIYTLEGSARMMEAVEAAGGMTEDADRNILNLAQFMSDGQMIRIPVIGEMEGAGEDASQVSDDEGKEDKINLNTAGVQDLMTIPGIGQSKAEAILNYREEKGKFEKIEDIMQISGIKEATFKKLEPYICVK